MGESFEDSPVLDLDGALWVPFKELFRVINSAIYKKDASSLQELEVALRNHRLDFFRLLKNPSKKAESREVMKNAATDGIRILGQHGKRVFPKAVTEEALILSDLFDLNEVVALELLLLGESQQPRLAAATRGLAAVLLYYDSHRCLVNALRALIQARDGRCWTLGLPREMTELVTKFTDDLWEEGLCNEILSHLKTFEIDNERSRLENNRALGGPKHRKQVLDLVEEIRTSLAECIYCWSSQSGLKSSVVLHLLDILSDVEPSKADGQLDSVQFALLMSVLYAIDLGVLVSTEDSDELVQNFPLIADVDFVANIHKELVSQRPWKCPSMKAAIQFSWAVSLRTMSQVQSIQSGHRQQYTEEDEAILDLSLDGGAFNFLCTMIIGHKNFHSEEFFVRRIHGLITDFIVFCPLKVKELRNRGDEIARILSHGDQVPDASVQPMLHFKHFLDLVTALYSKDPFGLLLNEEYWCADDFPGKFQIPSATFTNPTPKQVNLFKFVRLAGDLLPPLLYVPYIRMLCSLASSPTAAHHCFNLLKTNCSLAASSHYGTISWDHFFGTLHRYFASLRQEARVSGLQQQRVIPRSITPQEVEGLCTVLHLILTVVDHDDVARIALCESSEWTPHTVLLGLLSCWVPLVLKAQIVDTLSALMKSPEVAMTVWQLMESSKIIPVQADGSGSTFQMELEEVESHSEEYPLTRAMLKLLSVVVDSCQALDIPGSPGSSRYEPCVVYVINYVLSKFHLRPYKAAEEKWKVATLSLEFLLKLVLQYNGISDFKQPIRPELKSFPCGHVVMSNMLQDGLLLKTILYIIDESAKTSDEYLSEYPGKEDMENSALNCLKLVQNVLEKQEIFVTRVRERGANILFVGLDQLLMGINPRSQKADYLIRIAKFVSYSDFLPEHAFYAASILLQMCRSSVTQDRIVGVFSIDKIEMDSLRQGLVECLEVEDSEEEPDSNGTSVDSVEEEGRLRSSTRRTILRMLIYCLRYPPPNLALFLLGFEFTKTPQRTVLQDPGILGSTYTCFHAVLEILFRDSSTSELTMTSELCQQLVYTMCINCDTSGPTMRYLRTSHDFLYRQLKMIPFVKAPTSDSQTLTEINLLNRQAWLLKTIAVELRVAAASGQRSNLQRLIALLVDDKNAAGSSRCKLLSILDYLELTHSFPEGPQWEFFDITIIEQVISACERPTPSGCLAVDIRQLHNLLLTEINNLQGSMTLGQRPLIIKELHGILNYVNLRNRARLHLHSKQQLLEAWRLVTEMVLATLSSDFLEDHRQVTVILEIAHNFLHKVLRENAIPELVNPSACILPTLFSSLRQCFAISHRSLHPSQQLSWKPYSSSLEVALHNLIECVLGSGVGPHKVRANYYCAFLNLLKVCSTEPSMASDLQTSDELESDKFMKKCMEIICSYGNSFVEIICRDASNTNDITKMLAICCLSFIVANDRRQFVIQFMASNGYIQDFVNSLRADDTFLCTLPSVSNTGLRKLYVYETKMAFFVQLSKSIQGAQHLLYCGFLTCLADMQAFSMRPEHWSVQTTEGSDSPWLDSKFNFHHILVPALHVCLCLLTSCSGSILDTHSQAIHFLISHIDAFSAILKDCDNSSNSLQEISMIIAIFARVFAMSDILNFSSGLSPPAEVRTQLSRLNHIARNLLSVLVNIKKSKWSSHLTASLEGTETIGGNLETELSWAGGIVNLLCFYVNLVKGDGPVPQLVFGPSLSGSSQTDMFSQVSFFNDTQRMPSLGLLVFLIQYSLQTHSSIITNQQLHLTGKQQQPAQGIWAVDQSTEALLSTSDVKKEARHLDLVIYILEHSLYLLWFHLEFYLVKSVTKESQFLQTSANRRSDIRRLHDLSHSQLREELEEEEFSSEIDVPFYHSRMELENLKASLHPELNQSVLNTGLLDKAGAVIQYLEKTKRNQFLSVIVRRLRWLLCYSIK